MIEAALLLIAFASVAVPFGLWRGVLTVELIADNVLRTALVALILPAAAEELVFRGPLLAPKVSRRRVLACLAAYVLWHLIGAALFLPAARPVFWDGDFLLIATGLGAVASISVRRSGRLWPAILLHATVVVAWKHMLGGEQYL